MLLIYIFVSNLILYIKSIIDEMVKNYNYYFFLESEFFPILEKTPETPETSEFLSLSLASRQLAAADIIGGTTSVSRLGPKPISLPGATNA